MEADHMIYKDPKAEKKVEDRVFCPGCGNTVTKANFCSECGAPLTRAPKAAAAPMQSIGLGQGTFFNVSAPGPAGYAANIPAQSAVSDEQKPADDSGLTLLGEFCKKTVATIGGNGYDEIILYRNEADGSFQIHTYCKYEYMPKEIHRSFKAKDGAYAELLKLAERLKLQEYEGKTGVALCGGMYICKYAEGGVLHRVTTDNFGTDGMSIITQVGNLLESFKGEEIFAE